MLITSKAVVLNHFKYGETGIICNCYTAQEGFLSFLVKGVYGKKKKISKYNPLNIVEVVYQQKPNQNALHFFKSIETAHYATSLYQNPIKTAMVFFLTEMLQAFLKKDSHQNMPLYCILEENLMLFDQKADNFSEFHLFLTVKLIEFMGISPDMTHSNYPYFDMQNGNFCLIIEKTSQLLAETEKELFAKIFQISFSLNSKNILLANERKIALNLLLRYLKLHIDNFKEPHSLEILKQL